MVDATSGVVSDAQLRRAIVRLQHRVMHARLRHQSDMLVDQHLTMMQFKALMHVHSHPRLQATELAESIGAKPNVCTGVIQRLVDRGWVERARDDEDGRVRRLELTDDGHEFVAGVVREMESDMEGALEVLSREQLRQLMGIMTTLAEAAGVPVTEAPERE